MTGKWFRGITPAAKRPNKIDTSVAHSARVYDYWLGGKDNFVADRVAAEAVIAVRPGIITDIRAHRDFLTRAVRCLAADYGIRQFLDVGTGLPTAPNVHEVAQAVAPESRIAYVDNDPIVLAHARALLASDPEGATAYLDADLREPEKIINVAGEVLDLTEPVAVLLLGIMHLIPDAEDPHGIVARLTAAVPSGSYLAVTNPANDLNAAEVAAATSQYNQCVGTPQTRRRHAEVAAFFDGLDLLDPGVVQYNRWRPDPGSPGLGLDVCGWAGLARKR